jgi:glycerol-3-phosphate dehydrogenase subunit B
MLYDLAIIGSGFSGLLAAQQAHEKNLKFCVIAPDLGASQHFSGAFDVIDPRFENPQLSPFHLPTITETLERFITARPHHVYTQIALGQKEFASELVQKMKDFFTFYNLTVDGNGETMIAVFGNSGRYKPTAFALRGFGLDPGLVTPNTEVLVVDVPAVTEYPAFAIIKELQTYFKTVTTAKFTALSANRTSPLASLLQKLDTSEGFQIFLDFLKTHAGKNQIVIMPPILGVTQASPHRDFLAKEFAIKIVEMLSTSPSTAGLRFQNQIQKSLRDKKIERIVGTVTGFTHDGNTLQTLTVSDRTKAETSKIAAKGFLLATGKFLGGGIARQGQFRETVFGLPLFAAGRPLHTHVQMSQLIQADGVQKQDFLDIGVSSHDIRYMNLRACGHVLSGFDFTRERCGFGVSVATVPKL